MTHSLDTGKQIHFIINIDIVLFCTAIRHIGNNARVVAIATERDCISPTLDVIHYIYTYSLRFLLIVDINYRGKPTTIFTIGHYGFSWIA
jgi:hypothetical protein